MLKFINNTELEERVAKAIENEISVWLTEIYDIPNNIEIVVKLETMMWGKPNLIADTKLLLKTPYQYEIIYLENCFATQEHGFCFCGNARSLLSATLQICKMQHKYYNTNS